MELPLINIIRQNAEIKEELINEFIKCIDEAQFINGDSVKSFELGFSNAIGAQFSIACANGTDALYSVLKYLVKPGDEVIVPAMTWIATAAAVTEAGGIPIFCDIDPDTFTLCPIDLEKRVTPKTKGIIPVHLYGHPCEMDYICAVAERENLWVIEDCAQAHLATHNSRTVGSIGTAGTFSFFPSKNLGALGDSGAVVTNNEELHNFVRLYTRHGAFKKNEHEIVGINSRLDSIQASFLNLKLAKLNEWTDKRIQNAEHYTKRLQHCKFLLTPQVKNGCKHVYHLYTVLVTRQRDELLSYLNKNGVGAQLNYPKILPALKPYCETNYEKRYPNSFNLQSSLICLPLCSHIEKSEIDSICELIINFFGESTWI